MTTELLWVDYHDKVIAVAAKMYERNIGSALVKKAGECEGIITERDILRHCVMGSLNIFNSKAGNIMSSPVLSVNEGTSVIEACHIMREKKIKKLLVMDNKDAIKGIVTMTDIVNYLPTLYE
ncbi:TPA: CBS domain-containing protein [Candidatus Woesearchaeota archaeon]|nr:CBS domain-containing protein [Candidatus Woesearchaeota archaeon]HII69016.1 CBS domain-containing protein [Candidatus Woesearchaeota archaeon]